MKTTDVEIRLDATQLTPEGYLDVEAIIAKAGVYPYPEHGTVEAKLDSELFHEKSLKTLEHALVVDEHPFTFNGLVDSETATMYSKGFSISKPERISKSNGDELKIRFRILDKTLVNEVLNKVKRYISLGSQSVPVKRVGEFLGKVYDTVQTCITYNHIAITKNPRLGKAIKIILDSNQEIFENIDNFDKNDNKKGEVKKMAQITLGNVSVEVPDGSVPAITGYIGNLQSRIDSLDKQSLEDAKKLDVANKSIEDLNKKVVKLDSFNLNEMVAKRIELIEKAKKFKKEIKLDSNPDTFEKDLMVQVIQSKNPDFNPKDIPIDKIEGRFDSIVENFGKDATPPEDAKNIRNTQGRFDSTNTGNILDSNEQARAAAIAKMNKPIY